MPFSEVYIWVAPASDGNLGGIAGADAMCVANAAGAGFIGGTYTHRAILSDGTQDVRNIIPAASGPVRRPDTTLMINTWGGYFDGVQTLANSVSTISATVWTGLLQNGSPSGNDCNNWTSANNADDATAGSTNFVSNGRLFNSTSPACDGSFSFLCVSYAP